MSAIISSSTRRQLPSGPSRCRSLTILRPWMSSAASRVNHRLSLGNAAITVTPAEATRVLPRNQISRACSRRQQAHFFGEAPADLGVAAVGEKLDQNRSVDLQHRKIRRPPTQEEADRRNWRPWGAPPVPTGGPSGARAGRELPPEWTEAHRTARSFGTIFSHMTAKPHVETSGAAAGARFNGWSMFGCSP